MKTEVLILVRSFLGFAVKAFYENSILQFLIKATTNDCVPLKWQVRDNHGFELSIPYTFVTRSNVECTEILTVNWRRKWSNAPLEPDTYSLRLHIVTTV